MCLGGAARAANINATQQYEFQVEQAKQKALGRLTLAKAKGVRYGQALAAINQGANLAYQKNQHVANAATEKVLFDSQEAFAKFMKNSVGGQLLAAGRTGRSVERIRLAELGALGKFHAMQNASLSKLNEEIRLGERQLFEKVKNDHSTERAKVALTYQNPIQPKSPVMVNETMAAVTEGLSIASQIASLGTGFGGGDFWSNMFKGADSIGKTAPAASMSMIN